MTSKVVTLSADEATATVADATMGDILTTAFSMNSAVTGMYGVVQKAGLVIGGMAFQNNRLGHGLNPFSS
jgi:hypothetical protein